MEQTSAGDLERGKWFVFGGKQHAHSREQ